MRFLPPCLGLAVSTVAFGADLHMNLPQTFGPVRDKMAAGGVGSILVLGDSLSYNWQSWLPAFREHMQAEYGDAGAGYQGFSVWTGGAFNAEWVRGMLNQDTPPHRSLDGLWASSNSPVNTSPPTNAYFTSWSPQVRVHYVAEPGGGRFRVHFPDLTSDVISTNAGAAEVRRIDWVAAAPGTFRYQAIGDGWITVLGQENLTGAPGALIHRASNGGWGVGNFLQRDWTFDAQLSHLDPDLVVIWLGQNDQSYSLAGYQAAMNALVDRVLATLPEARICLIGTYDSGSSNIPRIVTAVRNVAHERGLGFVNVYAAAGNYQFFVSNGYLRDGLHFSLAGGMYLGELLFNVFMTDGASLTACYANCDESTAVPVLNVDDFLCFIDQFATAHALPHEQQVEHYANCDGSSEAPVLTVDDFICFIDAFAAGCH